MFYNFDTMEIYLKSTSIYMMILNNLKFMAINFQEPVCRLIILKFISTLTESHCIEVMVVIKAQLNSYI